MFCNVPVFLRASLQLYSSCWISLLLLDFRSLLGAVLYFARQLASCCCKQCCIHSTDSGMEKDSSQSTSSGHLRKTTDHSHLHPSRTKFHPLVHRWRYNCYYIPHQYFLQFQLLKCDSLHIAGLAFNNRPDGWNITKCTVISTRS